MGFNGFLDKFENFVRDLLLRVEQSLLFVILPVQRQVDNSNGLPKIAQLGSSRVDDASDLVSNNEFQILQKPKIVTHKLIL